jgi:hypothetical protein
MRALEARQDELFDFVGVVGIHELFHPGFVLVFLAKRRRLRGRPSAFFGKCVECPCKALE